MRRLFVFGLAFLVLAVAAALGAQKWKQVQAVETAAAAVEQHRAAASKQADRVRKLGDVVMAAKPLDASTVTIPMSGVSFVEGLGEPPTGAFVDADALNEDALQRDTPEGELAFDPTPFWGRCVAWLEAPRGDNAPPPPAGVEKDCAAFEAVRYVGVVRMAKSVPPEKKADGTEVDGELRAEALFYELSDAPRLLGGLVLDAKTDAADREAYRATPRKVDEAAWLRGTLRTRAYEALYAGMQKASPKSALPPPADVAVER